MTALPGRRLMAAARGAPGPIISTLRTVREWTFRVIGLLERRSRRSSAARAPLWLRRHTGPLAYVERSASGTLRFITSLDLVSDGATVLDGGCGFGVMAEPIATLLGPAGKYVGFDRHVPSVRWAQRHIAGSDSRLRFVALYIDASTARFPLGDGEVDLFLAKSLFTHLTTRAAMRALSETARVLKETSGRALITTFLFDVASIPSLPVSYSGEDPRVRWLVRARPEAAIAYQRDLFEELIRDAGLKILEFIPGFWPGRPELDGQDLLLLARR